MRYYGRYGKAEQFIRDNIVLLKKAAKEGTPVCVNSKDFALLLESRFPGLKCTVVEIPEPDYHSIPKGTRILRDDIDLSRQQFFPFYKNEKLGDK